MDNNLTKDIFHELLKNAGSICILGHVSPDGDCVGSVLGVYNYIRNLRGEEVTAVPYLEGVNEKFSFLAGSDRLCDDPKQAVVYDLAVVCDCGDEDRPGRFRWYMDHARKCVVIDHHWTNPGFGDYCLVVPNASSTCEVFWGLMEEDRIDKRIAECIYTGLVHDTGVFRHNSTSPGTLRIAARCMEYGVDFNRIVEETFFSMTFLQKKVLGWLLLHMEQHLDGRLITAVLDMETRKTLDALDMDMDGIVDHLRTIDGVLLAVYMYETKDGRCKLSFRSNSDLVDVSRIAMNYGGGGHRRAAGCFMGLDFPKNIREIEAAVRAQLEAADSD